MFHPGAGEEKNFHRKDFLKINHLKIGRKEPGTHFLRRTEETNWNLKVLSHPCNQSKTHWDMRHSALHRAGSNLENSRICWKKNTLKTSQLGESSEQRICIKKQRGKGNDKIRHRSQQPKSETDFIPTVCKNWQINFHVKLKRLKKWS